MFRYDLRLFLAAGAVLVAVTAAKAQSQLAQPAEPGATSDQQERIHGLENEVVELRRLVGKYQTQLAQVLVADEQAREFARLQASEEEARSRLTRVEELYGVARAELAAAVKDRVELQAQVARMAQRVDDEPGERAKLQKEREQLTTQLVVLTEELKRERVRQDAEIERAEQAAVSLGERLRQAMAENERLEGRYLQATESLATLQDGFRLISSDAESARQQLRLAREHEQKLQQQLAAARDERGATAENKELLAALATAREARREQTDELVRLRAELGGVSSERDQLKSAVKALEVAKAELSAQGAETKLLVDKMRAQIEETSAVREELESLRQQKQQFEIVLRGLRDKADEQGKLVAVLEKSNLARIQQEQEMGRLRGQLEGSAMAKKQLENALKVAAETRNRLRSRQKRVDTALAEVRTRLSETLTEAATTQQQLVAAQNESATLKQQVAALEAQNGKTAAELAKTVERLNARDTQGQEDVRRLELALAKANAEKGSLSGTLADRAAELEEARKALANAQTELHAASTRSGKQEQEIRRLKVALTTANKERENLASTLQKWDTQRAEANEASTGLQRRLASVVGELAQSAQTIGSLEAALAAAEKEKGALTAELQKFTTQAEQSTAAMVRIQEQFREVSGRADAQSREIERIKAELAVAVAAKAELTAAIQTARGESRKWREQQMASAAKVVEVNALLAKLNQEKLAADAKLQALSAEQQSLAKAVTKSYEQAVKELGPEIEQKTITVIEGPDRMTIRVGGAALFGPGQSSLRPESRAMLDKVVGLLKEFPEYDVRAEGHTDSTGNWSSNWELSASRAGAVVRYLQEKGIAPERLASTGYAFYRPVAANDTPAGRAANRRIEITLEPKK